MQPLEKVNTKGALYECSSLKNNLLFRLVLTSICHLRIEKKNPFWERFNQTLNKYIPAENKVR